MDYQTKVLASDENSLAIERWFARKVFGNDSKDMLAELVGYTHTERQNALYRSFTIQDFDRHSI